MRVLAAFLPVSAEVPVKAPCQKKKPITKASTDQSATTLQENFIFNFPLDTNMTAFVTDVYKSIL
jgi:hypothetical protein